MTAYPTAAPIFADEDHMAAILGYATTESEALARYADHFAGTGIKATGARKAQPERNGEVVDGWVPVTVDE